LYNQNFFKYMEQQVITTQSYNVSGGLNLGTVSMVHLIDMRSAVRAAFFILLIWFGFKIALEIIKYLMS
jgi:hypothetical protein